MTHQILHSVVFICIKLSQFSVTTKIRILIVLNLKQQKQQQQSEYAGMMMSTNNLDGKMDYCIYVLRDICRSGFLYVFSNHVCLSINYIMGEFMDGFDI
jgi:hypothetical protein